MRRAKTVCLDCRIANKGGGCPDSNHRNVSAGTRYRVPPKSDKKTWNKIVKHYEEHGVLPLTEPWSIGGYKIQRKNHVRRWSYSKHDLRR